MIRLQRVSPLFSFWVEFFISDVSKVTLLALHQYLGLGAELIASRHRGDKNLKYNQEFLDEALITTDSQEEPVSLENSNITPETPPTPSALLP